MHFSEHVPVHKWHMYIHKNGSDWHAGHPACPGPLHSILKTVEWSFKRLVGSCHSWHGCLNTPMITHFTRSKRQSPKDGQQGFALQATSLASAPCPQEPHRSPAAPQTHRAHFWLRAFALAVPSLQNGLPSATGLAPLPPVGLCSIITSHRGVLTLILKMATCLPLPRHSPSGLFFSDLFLYSIALTTL